jgi:lysophospholipase
MQSPFSGPLTVPAAEDFRHGRAHAPELFVRWRPAPEPRAVVAVIHGFGEHSGRYEHVFAALGARGYSCLAVDLRGFGRSEGRRAYIDDFDDYLDDTGEALALARDRGGELPLFLLGHSMGGLICTRFAQERGREADLAGLAIPAWKQVLGKVASRLAPRLSLPTEINPEALSHDPAVHDAVLADPLMNHTASARWFTESLAAQEKALDPARAVPCPLLLLAAGDDAIVEPEAERLFLERTTTEDAEGRVYDRLFHEIFNEVEQDEVLRDLLDWLDRHLPQA